MSELSPETLQEIRNLIHEEMTEAVADVERRLAQSYEINQRTIDLQAMADAEHQHEHELLLRKVFVEDLVDRTHRITGYTVTPNSPANGSIAWTNLHVVYDGVDYTITPANTALKYVWFTKPASGTTATLNTNNSMPGTNGVAALGANDALIFINNGGYPISVLETSLAAAVAPGAVGQNQLAADLTTLLETIQDDITNVQAIADGSIRTWYENTEPWPSGSPAPGETHAPTGNTSSASKTGDLWYDLDSGGAFRWTGPDAAAPFTNVWKRIADTDNSALATRLGRTTRMYVTLTATAPTVQAPDTQFTDGDTWVQPNAQNYTQRWNAATTAWVPMQFGDAALSGIAGSKVGTGIPGGNITTGTIAAGRIGAGVAGAALGSATGTVGSTQIANGAVGNANLATNAVQAKNINAQFHLLY